MLAAVSAMGLAMASCSDDDNGGQTGGGIDLNMTLQEKAVAMKCNDFGFKLLSEVNAYGDNDQKNIIISPLSANFAFSMLANGAEGETRTQIIEALGYEDADITDVNDFNRRMVADLVRVDPKVTLKFANSLWSKTDISVKSGFVNTLSTYYDAEVKDIKQSFIGDVNRWCADKTNGKITNFLGDDTRTPDLALFNAVYFKGIWSDGAKFDNKNTREGVFNNADGTTSRTMFMNSVGNAGYSETESLQNCILSFGNNKLAASFILPKEGVTIDDAIDALAEGDWEQLKHVTVGAKVTLSLPKFKIENEINFKDYIAGMGMENLFGNNADFSNISDDKLTVDYAKQKATFEINEEGAEAAAITGNGMCSSPGSIETKEIKVTFDRPFIYVVYEVYTRTILFLGEVNTFAN